MSFFERYAGLMEDKGLDPGSQTAADMMGTTRASISVWKTKQTTPKGDMVARMADALGVSTDYLLGRTDDPTDYAKKSSGKVVPLKTRKSKIVHLYTQLDMADRLKAEGVIQGMLLQDKYISDLNAAHARTDLETTPEMEAADESIMDDDDF